MKKYEPRKKIYLGWNHRTDKTKLSARAWEQTEHGKASLLVVPRIADHHHHLMVVVVAAAVVVLDHHHHHHQFWRQGAYLEVGCGHFGWQGLCP